MFYMLSLHTFYSASQRAVRDTAVQRRIMEHANSQNIAQLFLCNLNKAAVRIELSQKWLFLVFLKKIQPQTTDIQ